MTHLQQKLKEALAPREYHPIEAWRKAHTPYERECEARIAGEQGENTRLAPTHALLIECVEALDLATDLLHTPERLQDDQWYEKQRECENALTKLREHLEGK